MLFASLQHTSLAPQKKSVLYLVLIYFVAVGVLALRIHVEATHYLSPDSHIYLGVAQNLLDGNGPHIPIGLDIPNKSVTSNYFAKWPLGYPILIAGVSKVTGLSVFLSSKLINFMALAGIFWLLHVWFKERAWVPSLYFFTYSKMEVFSYSWSEGIFVVLVLVLAFRVLQDYKQPYRISSSIYVFLLLSGLFLLRYAGIIYFFLLLPIIIHLFKDGKTKTAVGYAVALVFAGFMAVSYLLINKYQTGFFTGYERYHVWDSSILEFLREFAVGLVNEFLFARNYWGEQDNVLWFVILVQVIFVVKLYLERPKLQKPVFESIDLKIVAFLAFGYLIFIVILKYILNFDTFNYRILSPFSTPLFLIVIHLCSCEKQHLYFKSIKPWYVAFAIFCLLMNLPKMYLLNLIFK